MDDLVQFLRERLDEDERTARAVLWPGSGNRSAWDLPASATVEVGTDEFYAGDRTVAQHIVRHDPARVLADIEVKRYYLELYADAVEREAARKGPGYHDGRDPEQVDSEDAAAAMLEGFARRFAAVYHDHPDYRPEWKP